MGPSERDFRFIISLRGTMSFPPSVEFNYLCNILRKVCILPASFRVISVMAFVSTGSSFDPNGGDNVKIEENIYL